MALVLKDRVKVTTTSTGTGSITLGSAATGFQSFTAIGNGNTTYYTIADQSGANWEVGVGTYSSAGPTLSRDTVLSSSNGGALVDFGAGAKDVFVTYPSEFSQVAHVGDVVAASSIPTGPGTWLETGKYYSKASYPALATALGDIPDIGNPAANPSAQLLPQHSPVNSQYTVATNGSITVAVDNFGGFIRTTTDGVTWNVVPNPANTSLNGVRYLNGNFVAVGNSAIAYSPDGTTWYAASTGGSALADVAYGGGVYVAVGTSGAILYSTNLVSWNAVPRIPQTAQLAKVVYGNGVFVSITASNVVIYSADGINWYQSLFSSAGTLVDVIYTGSQFAMQTSAYGTCTSTDGINWYRNGSYQCNAGPSYPAQITSCATNGTVSVAVGSSGTVSVTSDGVNWETTAIGTSPSATVALQSVFYLNGQFVIVGASGNIFSSTDGYNWINRTNTTATTTNAFVTAAYGNGVYVFGSSTSTTPFVTADLAEFTPGGATFAAVKIIYANSLFVAATSSGILTSPDGVAWNLRHGSGSVIYDIVYSGTQFVALVGTGTAYSTDGITWTAGGSTLNAMNRLAYGNGLFVAISGSIPSSIYTSPDGATWTARTVPGGYRGAASTGIAWDGTSFVVAGALGYYATSTDGITWTGAYFENPCTFYDVRVCNGKTVATSTDGGIVVLAGGTVQTVVKTALKYAPLTGSVPAPKTLAYDGSGKYVAAAGASYIMYSSDASTWAIANNPATVSGNFSNTDVFYFNGLFFTAGGTVFSTSSDGVSWTQRTVGGAAINSVAYGASVYVAVGNTGAVYSSPDGVTWTSRSAGSGNFLSIIYANSLFVAVGGSVCYTSPDGIIWTSRTIGSVVFNRVIYANSLFVAVGASGQIYTSPDGATWTQRTSQVGNQLNTVIWTGTQFVAVGATGACVTSPDGITWTRRPIGSTGTFTGLANNGSTVVAITNTNGAYCSTNDGLTWDFYPTPYGSNMLSVEYLGGKFVMAGTGQILTSTDGKSWTAAQTLTNNASIFAGATGSTFLGYQNSKYLTSSGRFLYSSTDAKNWTIALLPTSRSQLYAAAWDGTTYYVVGSIGEYYTSTNLTSWTATTDISQSAFYAAYVISGKVIAFGASATVVIAGASRAEVMQYGQAAYANASTVAISQQVATNGAGQYVATSNGLLMYSSDGVTWAFGQGIINPNYGNVNYLNGKYVAFGGNVYVSVSTDGINWTQTLIAVSSINDIAYGGGVYVAVGSSGVCYTSADGVSWVQRGTIGAASAVTSITYANSLFVCGNSTQVLSSPDGITWTARVTSGTSITKVKYVNSTFFALTTAGLYTSTNGTTWFYKTTAASAVLNDIVWSGSVYVAVGTNGVVFSSTDADIWVNRSPGNTSLTFNKVFYVSGVFYTMPTAAGYGAIFKSTDGIAWTASEIQPGVLAAAGSTVSYQVFEYVGGKFFAGCQSFLNTSSDGVTWTSANFVQYVPTLLNMLVQLNGYYYALSNNAGMYQSSDGVTFTPVRTIPCGPTPKITYGGGKWVAVTGGNGAATYSGNTTAVYTSTDGTTWAKTAEFCTSWPQASATMNAPIDIAYANGNFILALPVNRSLNVSASIYTSPDGATWTARNLPNGAVISSTIATDGTTAAGASSTTGFAGTYKSDDGGVTWSATNVKLSNAPYYAGGYWLFGGGVAGQVGASLSSLNNAYVIGAPLYTVNGYYVSFSTNPNVSKFGSGGAATAATRFQAIPSTNGSKLYATRSGVILVPGGSARVPSYPYLIMECSPYSYNTTTTFYVPASMALNQMSINYIYAGA